MVRTAIYARISSDDGTALGVARQVEDCRKLAAELGWQVVDEFIDNDVSAYSTKKRRPAYEAMLAEVRDGQLDAVLAYHYDRLHRRPIELEQFIETLTAAGVSRVRFVAGGELDPGNGDGMLVLRMMAAVGANESAAKSRRVSRKMEQNAKEGRPHGGTRWFGYEEGAIAQRPDEVAVIRQMIDRYLAGESLRSLAVWLDESGVPTVKGGRWQSSTVRQILAAPRNAGLRIHRGEVAGPGTWEPIIDEATFAKVQARMADAAVTRKRTPRKYALSGLVKCGACGNTMFSARRGEVRNYECVAGPDHGGCGRRKIVAGPVEDLVRDAVLYRLDTPELAAALAGKASDDSEAAKLADQLAADREQLDELAAMWADRQISSSAWSTARQKIEDRAAAAQRRLARMTRTDALAGIIGNGDDLRRRWDELTVPRQSAIIRAVVDQAVIGPGTRGARGFDPSRVEIVWKL